MGTNFFKHGGAGTPEYRSWCKMIERCHNPNHENYKYYGGRGIVVCERWRLSFPAFLDDMGHKTSPKHSIERKNNQLGYCKENCYWATQVEQMNNTRRTKMIEFNGETKALAVWCRELGLNYNLTRQRLYNNWSPERAFSP